MLKKYIGIDIGGTSIKMAIVNDEGTVLKSWSIPTSTENNGKNIPNEMIESIYRNITENEFPTGEYLGIGIGVPGPVSPLGDTVMKAVNLGWEQLPLKSIMEQKLNLPVALMNDANAAGLGELWLGSNQDVKDMLFVTLGTGVGGGIIIDGKIVNGNNSSGGEVGHIPVVSETKRICGCGNFNCLEAYASANGLVVTMKELLDKNQISYEAFTTKDIFQWIGEENQIAQQALDITLDYLGRAIAGIMNTLDPNEVVIGGGLSAAGDQLLIPLKEKIDLYVFPQIKGNYSLRKAQLGNNAGLLGAVYNLKKQIVN